MEMQNSAVTQMMATQTSILEEIRRLREKDELRQRFADIVQTPSAGAAQPTGLTSGEIDMFEGADYYPGMATPPPTGPYDGEQYYNTLSVNPYDPAYGPAGATPGSMSASNGYDAQAVNPSKYSTLAALPAAGGVMGATTIAASDAFNYNPSRMSKEATAEYFAQRSRGIQTGAVDMAGSAVQVGGFLGSFAVGGLLPSLAVGGLVAGGTAIVAGSMAKGAEDALNYQDILRRDGYKAFNAFESTTEYGGIGMSLDDQQEMSGFLRDLSDDNFLENDEMANILQGALDNKLLRSTSDMKTFKDKFKKIVEGVKEISLTLDQTLDEAVEFMGEMERRGVMTDNMSYMGAQLKIGASMQGVDANTYSQQVLQQTDSIVGGTSMDAGNVMEDLAFASYLVAGIEEESAAGDGVTKQYIKNSGGGTAVAGNMIGAIRGFVESDRGTEYLLALSGSAFEQNEDGSFSFNQAKYSELMESGKSFTELNRDSNAYIQTLDPTDQARLIATAGSVFNQSAETDESFQFVSRVAEAFENETGVAMDESTALMQAGVVGQYEDADILSSMLEKGVNGDVSAQFDSRAMKEEMDSAEKSRNPGLWNTIKYDFKKMITNPLGDMGQFVGDSVGSVSEDIQMMMTGIEENNAVGGALLPMLNEESLEELYIGEDSQHAEMTRKLAELQILGTTESAETDQAKIDMMVEAGAIGEVDAVQTKLSSAQFESMIDQLDSGTLSAQNLARLREGVESGNMEKDAEQRAQYILNKASGDYEGAGGKWNQFWDYNQASFSMNWDTMPSINTSPSAEERLNAPTTLEQIEDLEGTLKDDMSEAQKELQKLVASGETGVDVNQISELETAIRSGDVETVSSLTSNSSTIDLATTFQELAGRNDDLSGVKNTFLDFNRQAAASKEYAGDMLNFLETTGAFEEGEIKDLYGAYEKSADKLFNNFADMTGEELLAAQTDLYQQGKDIFTYMDSGSLQTVAEELAKKHDGIDMSDLTMDGYENTIDPAKVYDKFLNDVLRQQHTSESAAVDTEGAGDVSEVANDHKKAAESFVNALASEAKLMREVVTDIEDGNIKANYTYAGNS